MLHSRRHLTSIAVFVCLTLNLMGCATRINYVKEGGDYQTDSQLCRDTEQSTISKNGDVDRPNELNGPKDAQFVSPFESCMVSKGWSTEKTQFRLNYLKMTW
jgi:hypothetical protein